jgi:hypothetical protein
MDQRDWELFKQQMRRSNPPLQNLIMSLAVVGVFLAGLGVGIFAQKEQPTRIAQHATNASTLFPDGAPPSTLD